MIGWKKPHSSVPRNRALSSIHWADISTFVSIVILNSLFLVIPYGKRPWIHAHSSLD